MNRFIENALSATTALLIGFYVGSHWNGQEPANAPAELLAEPQLARPAALVPTPVVTLPIAGDDDVSKPIAAQSSPAVQTPQPACPEPELPVRQIVQAETVPGFDSKKLDAVYQQINSEDSQQRQQALLALAQLGTKEIMPDLIRVAADDEENSDLRRELIQKINWSGHAEELSGIIRKSRDAEARLTAVDAIAAANLTEAEFEELGKAMMNNFLIEPEDGIKIATLNCIQAVYPDSFQEVLENYPRVLSTPEVQNYLKMIETPPDEMEQATAEEKSEELGE